MDCQYCKKKFKTKYVLKTHQNTAQYCLKIQKKPSQFMCECCGKHLTTKRWLLNHHQICVDYRVWVETREYKERITVLEEQEERYEKKIRELQDKLENIAIKAVQRPTTTNNMNKTQVNNFIQNMQPVTNDHLLDNADNLTIEHVQKGAFGYAEYALEYPLKDRVICVDYSRRKIKFKDNQGNIITDHEMAKLAPMLFESIKDKSSKLVYEQNSETNNADMDSNVFERLALLFNTNADVKNGSEGIKSEFFHDFVKHVCSASVKDC